GDVEDAVGDGRQAGIQVGVGENESSGPDLQQVSDRDDRRGAGILDLAGNGQGRAGVGADAVGLAPEAAADICPVAVGAVQGELIGVKNVYLPDAIGRGVAEDAGDLHLMTAYQPVIGDGNGDQTRGAGSVADAGDGAVLEDDIAGPGVEPADVLKGAGVDRRNTGAVEGEGGGRYVDAGRPANVGGVAVDLEGGPGSHGRR